MLDFSHFFSNNWFLKQIFIYESIFSNNCNNFSNSSVKYHRETPIDEKYHCRYSFERVMSEIGFTKLSQKKYDSVRFVRRTKNCDKYDTATAIHCRKKTALAVTDLSTRAYVK